MKEAMLTEIQRDFIRGDKKYEGKTAKQQRYQMRERIRHRARNTFRDMTLLFEHLDSDEVRKIFVPEEYQDPSSGIEDRDPIYQGMIDTLGLLFMSFYDRERDHPQLREDDAEMHAKSAAEGDVDRLVESGLRRALGRRGMDLRDYSHLTYETEPFPMDEVTQRFLDGESLSWREFRTMKQKSDFNIPNQSLRFSLQEAHTQGLGIDFGDGRAVEPDEVPGRSEGDRDEDTDDE